ncbi:MAG: helix-turn-helix transcriptional regulator [Bacteroidota bacterium]
MSYQLITAARKKRKWSQQKLAAAADVSQPTISRIESGNLQGIDPNVLVRIADLLDLNYEDIQSTEQNGSLVAHELMKVGVGYCAWASPVFSRIVEKGGIPGAMLTTYSKKTEDASVEKPHYYDFSSANSPDYILKLPRYPEHLKTRYGVLGNALGNEHIEEWDDKTELRFFTAQSLLYMIDRDELDGVFIPGDLYETYSNKITRVARIMHTVRGGCLLSVISTPEILEALDLTKDASRKESGSGSLEDYIAANNDFWEKLNELAQSPEKFGAERSEMAIIYARRTIAESHYREYIHASVNQPGYNLNFNQLNLDIGDYDKLKQNIITIFDKLKESDNIPILFFLGWEPQTSYLQDIINSINNGNPKAQTLAVRHTELFDTQPNKAFLFLSFDFFLSNRFIDHWIQSPSLNSFLTELEESVSELKDQ